MSTRKIIALIPVKNEAWILRETLQNTLTWADTVIVADQQSSDETRAICRSFSGVTIIDNPYQGHSNKVRWLLLDYVRTLPGEKLIVCIDADEAIPPKMFIDEIASLNLVPGDVITANWIQLWKTPNSYNATGVWKNNLKAFAWCDDDCMNYDRVVTLNDHTSRVPGYNERAVKKIKTPLLHLQFLAWEKTQWKQAWYRCNELLAGVDARRINHKYAITLPQPTEKLLNTPKEWLEDVTIPKGLFAPISYDWHREEILRWFNDRGIEYFEPLQIWHISDLREQFIDKVGREPKLKVFPTWLVTLNTLRHKLF